MEENNLNILEIISDCISYQAIIYGIKDTTFSVSSIARQNMTLILEKVDYDINTILKLHDKLNDHAQSIEFPDDPNSYPEEKRESFECDNCGFTHPSGDCLDYTSRDNDSDIEIIENSEDNIVFTVSDIIPGILERLEKIKAVKKHIPLVED